MGSGQNFIPLVSLTDTVDAYVRAVEGPPVGKVLNIVDDEPLRMRELGTLLLNEFGGGEVSGLPVWLGAIFAGGPVAEAFSGSYRTKNARAKTILGWQPRYSSFRVGIKEIVAKYKKLDQY